MGCSREQHGCLSCLLSAAMAATPGGGRVWWHAFSGVLRARRPRVPSAVLVPRCPAADAIVEARTLNLTQTPSLTQGHCREFRSTGSRGSRDPRHLSARPTVKLGECKRPRRPGRLRRPRRRQPPRVQPSRIPKVASGNRPSGDRGKARGPTPATTRLCLSHEEGRAHRTSGVSRQWWPTPVIQRLRGSRQENCKFKAGLRDLARASLKVRNEGLGMWLSGGCPWVQSPGPKQK